MSAVIKAGDAGPILKRLSTVDLADHLAEAHAVIAEARRKGAQILSHARRESTRLAKEARESGYEAGYRDGYTEGTDAGHKAAHQESIERFNSQHTSIVSAMEHAIAEIDAIKNDLAIAAQRDLLDFAVMVAGRLTFAIGRLHPETATANLSRALQLVGSRTDLTIRVHPDDVKSIEMFAESVLKRADESRVVTVVADGSLAPGGCKVGSELTDVDAALETQVEEMVSLLLGGRAGDV